MKSFKQHIFEKLKVNTNKNSDPRDYETVDMLSTNASDKRKFMEYLQDCIKQDKYAIQASDVDFFNSKVLFYYSKYMRSLCNYSVNDTYIELYDRIIDALRENLFITEKLKISSNKEYVEQTLFPSNKEELKRMIEDEISKNGNECSLNHINVSEIRDMSSLFYNCKSNVDISEWDVSNVTNMRDMFAYSKFNPDISKWDVSNVTNMYKMFQASKFNGDISEWNVSNVEDMERMFFGSEFNGDISNWDVSNVEDMSCMFYYSKFNGDISTWDVSNVTDMSYMFEYSPLQNNPPKWYNQ